jgi:hypothetical protein
MEPKRYIDFYGDTVRWFTGAVVDINDPENLGRVKVRIYGIHSDSQVDLPDADLPWAQIVVPVTEGGTNGLGNNLGIKVGALVFGMFLDGKHSQLPMIFGSLPKFEGDGITTNSLATGTQTKSYTPDSTIGEPDDPYAAEYPKNRVYETESGHVKEYDDTPNATRIRELHQSGTFYQINHDGDLVTHIVRDGYRLVVGNDSVHVEGSVRIIADQGCTVESATQVSVEAPSISLIGKVSINGF